MSVIVTKEVKKKRILLAIFAVSIIATFFVLYFGGMLGGGSPVVLENDMLQSGFIFGETEQEINVPISDIRLKILDDERFTSLQDPPGVPVSAETTGNRNPFSD
jgi:hypothetical protein